MFPPETFIDYFLSVGGTASYDLVTNIIHLDGVNITGGYGTDYNAGAIVYTEGSGTFYIEVTGANTVAGDRRMNGATAGLLIGDPANPDKPNNTAVELNIAGGKWIPSADGVSLMNNKRNRKISPSPEWVAARSF